MAVKGLIICNHFFKRKNVSLMIIYIIMLNIILLYVCMYLESFLYIICIFLYILKMNVMTVSV